MCVAPSLPLCPSSLVQGRGQQGESSSARAASSPWAMHGRQAAGGVHAVWRCVDTLLRVVCLQGGKANVLTTRDMVHVVELGGREYLWYQVGTGTHSRHDSGMLLPSHLHCRYPSAPKDGCCRAYPLPPHSVPLILGP